MLNNRTRLREAIRQVPNEVLRKFIEECIAIRSNSINSTYVPRKEYRAAAEFVAEAAGGPATTSGYVSKTDQELRQEQLAPGQEQNRKDWSNLVRLEKLELTNFGSYFGHHQVDLAPAGEKNVTVFSGPNGAGKSTLFNAINWALYGEDFIYDLAKDNGKTKEDLVNHKAFNEAAGDLVETSVLLWFSVDAQKHYVRRSFTTEPLNGNPSAGNTSTMLSRIDGSGNHSTLPEESLSQVLSGMPKSVKDFYLSDGERINRFTAPGARTEVKRAISKIVGVTLMEEVIENLDDLSTSLRSAQKKAANNGAAEAIDAADRQRDLIAGYKKDLADSEEAIADLRAMLDALDKKLRDSPDTGEIQKRRQIHQQSLNTNQERISIAARELRDSLADAFQLMALPAIAALERELDKQRTVGELPGVISQQFLQELLDQHVCLCHRPLNEGDNARAVLEQRLQEVAGQGKEKQDLLELYYDLRGLQRPISDRRDTLKKRERDYYTIHDEQKNLQSALQGISEELQGLEVVNREGWEQERRDKMEILHATSAAKLALQKQIVEAQDVLKTLDAQVGKLTEAESTAKNLFDQISWVEAAQNTLAEIVKEFSSRARIEMERRTATLWQQLLSNVSIFDVHVTEGFELNVVSPVGTSGLAQLSMGQQQCLGLAFIAAVAQVAETKPPLVIDMPFGRLSDAVQLEVATALPALTSQLIIFVLPGTEWREPIEAAMLPTIARMVFLESDPTVPTSGFRVSAG